MALTVEDRKKIDWLNRYSDAKVNLDSLKEECQELENTVLTARKFEAAAPRKSQINDLSDIVTKRNKIRYRINREIKKQLNIFEEIENSIEKNNIDKRGKALLRYRYINCYKWEKIAELMTYSDKQLFRIHEKTIKDFKPIKLYNEPSAEIE